MMNADQGALVEVLSAAGEAADAPIVIGGADEVRPPQQDITPEQVAEASGGGLADRMRARLQHLQQSTTRDFPIPGWGQELLLRARLLERTEWLRLARGATTGDLIVACTVALRVLDGEAYTEVPGWGPDLAGLLGMPADTPPTVLVSALMADRPGYVGTLAQDLLAWQQGQVGELEVALGE